MRRLAVRVRCFAVATLLVAPTLASRGAGATAVAGGAVGGQTWTPAGNPYVVAGDITVPPGTTLTIQAGTDVRFQASDSKESGIDVNRIELTVNGALNVAGTPASPVTFELDPAQTGNWYGIVVATGAAAASIVGASITGSVHAITSGMTGATLTVTRTNIQNTAASGSGVSITAGSATLDGLTIGAIGGTNPMYGLNLSNPVAGATPNTIMVLNTVVAGCTYNAYLWGIALTVDISSSTFDGGSYGVYIISAGAFATMQNSIVSNASNAGVSSPSMSQFTVAYSDVWNNGTDYSNVAQGTTNLSVDPQYVLLNDYHLQPSSPCIDSGVATGNLASPYHDHDGTPRPLGADFDMGAYEYNPGGAAGGASGSGAAGASGVAGAGGTAGAAGATGGSSVAGARGTAGVGGAVGGSGAAGGSGVAGANGAAGTTGVAGIGGASGASGAVGTSGIGGTQGAAGASGAADVGGRAGTAGATGTAGSGAAGSTGAGGRNGGASGGCGCETAGTPTSAWVLFLAFVALLARRRRHL